LIQLENGGTTVDRERIVVGVDGSSGSHEALSWALDEARRHGADVEVVYCWSSPSLAAASAAAASLTVDEISAEGKAHLDAAMATCADAVVAARAVGVEVATQVLEGEVGLGLIEESKDAAMLVVGRHGRGVLSRLMLGSVSRHVAAHAQCPVVVVPESGSPR
jgi:nucleotide-binding universal stress UspA family protein